MAKKRKPGTKAATRRAPRRGKQAAEAEDSAAPAEPASEPPPAVGDSAVEPAPESQPQPAATSEDPTPSNPSTSSAPIVNQSSVPPVVLHKKFGKYRCLFNNDDTLTRKYDIGSDSETNSSLEIRVVDPCASSESDSNAALDTQSDTNSATWYSPGDSGVNSVPCISREMSPSLLGGVPFPSEMADIPLPAENVEITDKIQLELVPLPPPLEPKVTEPSVQEVTQAEKTERETIIESIDLSSIPEPEPRHEDIPLEEEQPDYGGDDDEMITIVQIVEDDNPEMYYNIKIESPKHQMEESAETSDHEGKKQDVDYEKHFEQLSITTPAEFNVTSPMDCAEINNRTPPCHTPDLHREPLDMARPDPSVTPSSTLSDDSNSSRITEQNQGNSNDSAESSPTGVRRSSRIKTISNMKQKTKGYGLVKTPLKKALITQTKLKLEELGSDSQEKSNDVPCTTPNSPSFPVPSDMPVKVKSRWRRSSELEMVANSPASSPLASPSLPQRLLAVSELPNIPDEETVPLSKESYDRIIEERMNQFQHLDENDYLCERMVSKETKKMICDCFMTKEELERGELACGEDCLNRLLMIECNSRCPVGDRCTNRRFQKKQNALLKVFYADKKGCGVEASVDIPGGEFLMEYVGEVLDYDQFYKRAQTYSDENNLHHYFMSLKGDTVIDATLKGNISRFINHSCDPNAETQKWTVNGELRIGFFSKRDIQAGEEITFDYQFQRFGKEAQRCYCGADACRGWIGAEPDSDEEDEEEEEEDVSTSKSGASTEEEAAAAAGGAETPRERLQKPRPRRKYKPKAKDLVQDADIEEDLEALSRTGVKNQSHTLRLSRLIVRAKTRRCQTTLLRLLRDADLPCRRLFLDYRGLRLLGSWCNDAPTAFRLEMLQTVDRLPIPNKTMIQESRFFTVVERWLSAADAPPSDNLFIDEATGLPMELANLLGQEATTADSTKENAVNLEKIKDLSTQLLERWASLKEVFKIPKKERIQQMKEHERQANVERRAADSSGGPQDKRDKRERPERRERTERAERAERERTERERDRERERERERDRDRERERDRYRERERERSDREREREREKDDRDRRKRRSSPENRRSIRLSERVLAAVPPLSKEERRRAFAEAAARADCSRRAAPPPPAAAPAPPDPLHYPHPHYWPPDSYAQMFPPGVMPQNMVAPGMPNMPNMGNIPNMGNMPNMPNMGNIPNMANMSNMGNIPNMGNMPNMGMMPGLEMEWRGGEFPRQAFYSQFPHQQLCVPQANMGMMGISGYGMGGFVFGQQLPAPFPAHPPDMLHPPHAPHPQQLPPQLPGQPPTTVQAPASSPEPVVLPSGWRSARDSRGREYYYHVKLRQPQWLPPPPPPANQTEESSSEEEAEQPDDVMRMPVKGKLVEGVNGIYEVIKEPGGAGNGLIPEHALLSLRPRKRRPGLVTERPISPRTEEDKLAGRMEVKRYKQTKEKLRRRRERLLSKFRLLAAKPAAGAIPPGLKINLAESDTDSDEAETEEPIVQPPVVPVEEVPPSPVVVPVAPVAPEASVAPVAPAEDPEPAVDQDEVARKIKEQFRSAMARVMVQHLNPYRHSEAKAGRITCTADFKHLARKLTHFVMLKELKHCRSVDELVVTDSVRSKAKMFVKKYMAKFGPVYRRPADEAD